MATRKIVFESRISIFLYVLYEMHIFGNLRNTLTQQFSHCHLRKSREKTTKTCSRERNMCRKAPFANLIVSLRVTLHTHIRPHACVRFACTRGGEASELALDFVQFAQHSEIQAQSALRRCFVHSSVVS
jgi:hypothetical protein